MKFEGQTFGAELADGTGEPWHDEKGDRHHQRDFFV
jgi:hypothetical protein